MTSGASHPMWTAPSKSLWHWIIWLFSISRPHRPQKPPYCALNGVVGFLNRTLGVLETRRQADARSARSDRLIFVTPSTPSGTARR